jgi:hypothetical protein
MDQLSVLKTWCYKGELYEHKKKYYSSGGTFVDGERGILWRLG